MNAKPASDLLRSEHRLIENEIDQLLQAAKHPEGDLAAQVRRAIAAMQCLSGLHFEKEEGVFYPALRANFPDLMAQLEEQHGYAREVESHLVSLLDSIDGRPTERQFNELVRFSIELYDVVQHHIVDEEDQLLRLADQRLSVEEQAYLATRMKELDPLICSPRAVHAASAARR